MSDSTSEEIAAIQAARKAAKAEQSLASTEIHPSLLPSASTSSNEDGTVAKKKKRSSRFDVSLDVSRGDGDYEMNNGDNNEEENGAGGDKPTRLLDSCKLSRSLCIYIEDVSRRLVNSC
jgi:hypothetical protein